MGDNYSGLIGKNDSGWTEDGISNGITTIKKLEEKIRYFDLRCQRFNNFS
jgi:hypothetical protein